MPVSTEYWRSVPHWYVKHGSPGSYEGKGDDPSRPVTTVDVIRDRTGSRIHGGPFGSETIIEFLDDVVSGTGTFDDFQLDTMDNGLKFLGQRTSIATGTISAVQVPNGSTETDGTVTDASVANWNVHAVEGRQVEMTSGAANGGKFWIAKDKTGHVGRISECITGSGFSMALANISAGNYKVVQLTKITPSVWSVARGGYRIYQNLDYVGGASFPGGANTSFAFDCSFGGVGGLASGSEQQFFGPWNCQCVANFNLFGRVSIFGGIAVGISSQETEFGQFLVDSYTIQGTTWTIKHGALVRTKNRVGIWDAPGNGIQMLGPSSIEVEGQLYGSGHSGYGASMGGSTLMQFNASTCKLRGTSGDRLVGQVPGNWSDGPFSDDDADARVVVIA